MAKKQTQIVKDPRERKPVGDLGTDRDGYGRQFDNDDAAKAIKLAFRADK